MSVRKMRYIAGIYTLEQAIMELTQLLGGFQALDHNSQTIQGKSKISPEEYNKSRTKDHYKVVQEMLSGDLVETDKSEKGGINLK